MGYSQNEAAFYYAKQNRRKKADNARKAAGKGSAFGDGVTLFGSIPTKVRNAT
ncbi:hypothetical protein [Octadecabacter arcticus]|jgi:hypothetical protein|uniref:hypothetical protein n=1 Tax=Octadecabacter arcticus TaxID=53946 RepID=UPI0003127214|nr:hypothetical protein [Octadecabacter arcticus]